jgi:ribosome-binding factor A
VSKPTRVQKVQRELLQLLSEYLNTGLNEPLPCYASITAVEVSPDLRHAKVFFRLVGEAAHTAEGEKTLSASRPLFQKQVAHGLKLKFCPVLRFEFGKKGETDEIDRLFEALHKPKSFGD